MQAAEGLWKLFSKHSATQAAARRMVQNTQEGEVCLGCTPWNAYSFNIDFRTGAYSFNTLECVLLQQ